MTDVAIGPESDAPLYQNILAIASRGKAIPYGSSGSVRADGQANFGFKNLKGHPELLNEVPELASDPALRSLVAAINAPTTGLFSVGCLSGVVHDDHGWRMTGYIEFAHNSRQAAADAASYFPVFFHFDRLLQNSGFGHQVQFYWELCGAHFLDAASDGFTAAVTMNTHPFATMEGARDAWRAACGILEVLLVAIPPHTGEPIYPIP